MRQFINIFLVLVFSVPVIAWSQEKAKTDVERDGLKGPVLKVRTIYVPDFFTDSNKTQQINFGSFTGMNIQLYDAEGKKLYDSSLLPHNPYLKVKDNFHYKIYEYAGGQPVKVISGDVSGVRTETPQPIRSSSTPEDVQYNYDKKQNKTEIVITTHKNKPVKVPYLNAHGLLNTTEPNDSGGKVIWRYYFDQNGNDTLITFRIVDKKDSIRLYWINNYKYDEKKNILERTSYDWRASEGVKRYTYIYDEYGNWTTRILYINDQIYETRMRHIDYKKD